MGGKSLSGRFVTGVFLFIGSTVTLVLAWELRSFALFLVAASLLTAGLIASILRFRLVALPVLATLISFLGVELVLGATLGRGGHSFVPLASDSENYFRVVDGLGYQSSPGKWSVVSTRPDGEIVYNVVYTIGSDGFRQSTASSDAPISVFGGSFTFGEGLQDDETLPFFLSELMEQEVKNYGIHGYGLHQAVYLMQKGAGSQDGINILQTAPWHAPRSSCELFSRTDSPKYDLVESELVYVGNCNQFGLFARVIERSETFQAIRPIFDTSARVTDDEIALYLAMVQEMARITESQNSKFLIGFIRASDATLAESSWSNDEILAALSLYADDVVDLTLAPPAEKIPPELRIHQTDEHPSALANEKRAGILAATIDALR